MKKIHAVASITLTAALAATLLAGCGSNNNAQNQADTSQGGAKKKLVMATEAQYEPYEFHKIEGGTDKVVGFDIDIATYVMNKLGYDFEVKDMSFDGLIPALQAKRADFVMAGMTPKEERKKNADFSDIYYEAKNTIVAKKDANLTTPDALKGKKVGVQLGSIQEGEAKKIEGVQVVELNKIPDMIQELKVGRIDAAIIEDTVAKGYTNANKDLVFNTIPNTEAAGSAAAFPKGSPLVADFNKVLKEMKDNGEMDKLVKKWFEK